MDIPQHACCATFGSTGTWIAGVTAAAWILLTLESLPTFGAEAKGPVAALVLGGAGLLALLLSAHLGLTQHSGWGFWQKLTVRDGVPAPNPGSTARGWGTQLLAPCVDFLAWWAGKPSGWAGCLVAAGGPVALLGLATCASCLRLPGPAPASTGALASARLARCAAASV